MFFPLGIIVLGALLTSLGFTAILKSFAELIVKKSTDNQNASFFVSSMAITLGILTVVIGLMFIAPFIVL